MPKRQAMVGVKRAISGKLHMGFIRMYALGFSAAVIMYGSAYWDCSGSNIYLDSDLCMHVIEERFFDLAVIGVLGLITAWYSQHLPNRKKIQGAELCLTVLNKINENGEIVRFMEQARYDVDDIENLERELKEKGHAQSWTYEENSRIMGDKHGFVLFFDRCKTLTNLVNDNILRYEDLVYFDRDNIRLLYKHNLIKNKLVKHSKNDLFYNELLKLSRKIEPMIEKMYYASKHE